MDNLNLSVAVLRKLAWNKAFSAVAQHGLPKDFDLEGLEIVRQGESYIVCNAYHEVLVLEQGKFVMCYETYDRQHSGTIRQLLTKVANNTITEPAHITWILAIASAVFTGSDYPTIQVLLT